MVGPIIDLWPAPAGRQREILEATRGGGHCDTGTVDFRTDSLISLAGRVRDGDVSAREMVRYALDQIEDLNPSLNAFVVLDGERAMTEAASLDERNARGEEVGALAGIPFAVKDLEDVAGLPTTHGSLVATETRSGRGRFGARAPG